MTEDGCVYVAELSDYDGSLICGAYTSLDDALDCLRRSDALTMYRWATVFRVPLDCDYDSRRTKEAYIATVPELLAAMQQQGETEGESGDA